MVARWGRVKACGTLREDSLAQDSSDLESAAAPAVSEDAVLGGRVRLLQPVRGYRAGLDAALLAAACPGVQRVFEAGCGPGGALLAAAVRYPDATFVGLERNPASVALARRNIALNHLAGRVEVVEGDVGGRFSALDLAPFDAALCNPPFFDDAGAIRGPLPERRGAYLADDGLGAWLAFLLKAVREGGEIVVIHRADRLADLLGGLGGGAGSFRVRPVAPFADAPAKRVLVRATKTGKAPLILLPPLVLHDRGGTGHTAQAEAILRGDAALGWD